MAEFSQSQPKQVKRVVVLCIIIRDLYESNGLKRSNVTIIATKDINVVHKFIEKICEAILDNSFLSFLLEEHSLIAYVVIPKDANSVK